MSREKNRQQVYFVFLDAAKQTLQVERQVLLRKADEFEFRDWCTRPRMLPEHRRREVAPPYQHAHFEPRHAFYLRNDRPEPRIEVLSTAATGAQPSFPWKREYASQRAGPGRAVGGLFVVLTLSDARAESLRIAARRSAAAAAAASTTSTALFSSSLKRGNAYVPNPKLLSLKKVHRVAFGGAEDPLRPEQQIRLQLQRKLRRKVARAALKKEEKKASAKKNCPLSTSNEPCPSTSPL